MRPEPESEEDDRRRAWAQAMRYLARRDYAQQELRERLKQKGYKGPVIDQVLHDLLAEGWLSERRFVESFVRARRDKGYGPVRIRAELAERGVDEAAIGEIVESSSGEWFELAVCVWRKRFGQPPEDFAEWARQKQFLYRRGFTNEQIEAIRKRDFAVG